MINSLRRDIPIAIRTLARQPSFTVTATLALALAIAVNTSMFSILDAMLNPRIGAQHPEELRFVSYFSAGFKRANWDVRARAVPDSGRTYSAITGWWWYGNGGIVERSGVVTREEPVYVKRNFFPTMQVKPVEGVLVPPTDDNAAVRSAIISVKLRNQLFSARETAVGQTLTIDGRSFDIIGVVQNFPGSPLLQGSVWLFPSPDMKPFSRMVRLRTGMTDEALSREFKVFSAQIALAENTDPKDAGFRVDKLSRQFEIKHFHYALIGSALAILIVACTNLANLQLARGLGRASELAIRSAIGASRQLIVGQLLIEGAVLATGAMVLAILLSLVGNAVIRATIPPTVGEFIIEPQTSWHMVVFAGIAAAFSLILVGLAPALRASRVDLNSLLKSRSGTGAHRKNRRVYGTLVITQIALTLPLVSAAVLLSRSAMRTAAKEWRIEQKYGFDTEPLVVATIFLPASPTAKLSMADISANLMSRARAVPGVADAAIAFHLGPRKQAITIGQSDGSVKNVSLPMWTYNVVTPSYFRTFGIPMARGKDFREGVADEGNVILDPGTAWFLWPRQMALGRQVKFAEEHTDAPWHTIQGVRGDHLSEEVRDYRRVMDTLAVGSVYQVMTTADSLPEATYMRRVDVTVRASGDPTKVASLLRRALTDVAKRPAHVRTFEENEQIPQQIARLTFFSGLFTTFGLLALGLSGLGVYGIVAQSVADRQREVAVRIALGATPRNIVYVLIREGNVLVLAGVAIGLFMTKQTMEWLAAFTMEVDTYNAILFGILCILLFCAMVLSALLPALRATRMDPMAVLRAE